MFVIDFLNIYFSIHNLCLALCNSYQNATLSNYKLLRWPASEPADTFDRCQQYTRVFVCVCSVLRDERDGEEKTRPGHPRFGEMDDSYMPFSQLMAISAVVLTLCPARVPAVILIISGRRAHLCM